MKNIKQIFAPLIMAALSLLSLTASAADFDNSLPGVSGYDLVAYHADGKATKGNGFNVAVHDGVNYLFASEDNKKTFEANPEKYLPAYGGWCAFGVALGKKFYSDPEAWKIVNGRLYLNLDKKIQADWSKDIPGQIKKANKHWTKIKDKSPASL